MTRLRNRRPGISSRTTLGWDSAARMSKVVKPRVGDELPLLLISVVIFGVMSGAWYLAMLSIKRRAGWWWQAQLAALAIGLVCSLVLYQQYR